MHVERLALEDFRNYEREAFEFSPGLNLVIGRNAQGKTNLLEAAYCLGGFGSPRGPDSTLIRDGTGRAIVHAEVARGERKARIDIEFRPGRGARALVNGSPVQGMRALRELTTCVFFGPDELSLIKGSPEGRRRFLDDLVVKLRPSREGLRREWERVLKQRNALLKSIPRSGAASREASDTLAVWDEAYCKVGAELTAARLDALDSLSPFASKRYEEVAGAGRLELAYASSWITPDGSARERLRDDLAAALAEVRNREIERGMSLVGPQRDDVDVHLAVGSASGTLDARLYASQGDQRTCALALKLGEHDLLTDALGDSPLLLLDDVFSELDPGRREWLASAVRGVGQTLVSSAEPGAVEASDAATVIEIEGGRKRDG